MAESVGEALPVREALARSTQQLRGAGVPEAALDAAVLLARVLGTDTAGVYARRDTELGSARLEEYWRLVARRAGREPLAYITGEREFMSLAFLVDRRVLIPRPETEILVEEALGRLSTHGARVRVADVGTGSGAIAVSIARYLPGCGVVASDVSPAALQVAGENARRQGVADRVRLVAGEGAGPLRPWAPYGAILCNPPYVGEGEEVDPEVRYEPRQAWCAGPDPLAPYRRLAREAADLLEPGGFLAVEVGAGRASAVVEILGRHLVDVTVRPDLSGIPRVVIGTRAGSQAKHRAEGRGGCPWRP